MASRHLVLEELGDPLAAAVRPSDRLTRVGIDGVDGAGKTRLAEELAQARSRRGRRPAVRITLDSLDETHERYRTRYLPDSGATSTSSGRTSARHSSSATPT